MQADMNCLRRTLCAAAAAAAALAGGADRASFTAHSMLTRDGRRMISRQNGGKTVYALCDRMFIGDDGRRVKDLEASSYHILPLQLDPATGEARLLFGELSP